MHIFFKIFLAVAILSLIIFAYQSQFWTKYYQSHYLESFTNCRKCHSNRNNTATEHFTSPGNLCSYKLDDYQKMCLMSKNNITNESDFETFWQSKCKDYKDMNDIDCDIARPENVNILESAATLKARGKPVHPLYYETERHSIGTPFEKDANGVFGTKWSDSKTGRNSYWGYGPQGDWRIQSTESKGLVKIQEFGGKTVVGTNVPANAQAALTVDGGSIVSHGPVQSNLEVRTPQVNTGSLSFFNNILGLNFENDENLRPMGTISVSRDDENDNALLIDPVTKLIVKGPLIVQEKERDTEYNVGDTFQELQQFEKEMKETYEKNTVRTNEQLSGISMDLTETKERVSQVEKVSEDTNKEVEKVREKVDDLEKKQNEDQNMKIADSNENSPTIIRESDQICVDDVCLKGNPQREICIGEECLDENMVRNLNKFISSDRIRVGDSQILDNEIRVGKTDLKEDKWCMGSNCMNDNDIKRVNKL